MIYKKETPFDRVKYEALMEIERGLRANLIPNPVSFVYVTYREVVNSLKFKCACNSQYVMPEGVLYAD